MIHNRILKVLITGASGFVGSRLVQRFQKCGHQTVTLSRTGQGPDAFLWDPEKREFPNTAFEGVEAIIHLAGESIARKRWGSEQKTRIYDSRVLGTRNFVEYLISHQSELPDLRLFISASATGYYGDRGDEVLNETSSPGEGFLAHVCVDWEREVRPLSERVRTAVFRIGMVLGRGGGAIQKILPVFKFGLGGQLGNGTQWISWIHLDDLISIFHYTLIDPRFEGVFNATSIQPVTNKEFTLALASALRRPAFLPVPRVALRMILGEMSSLVLEGQRVVPNRLLELGYVFEYTAIEKALKTLLYPV